jgi:hypothetical protein
MFARRSLQRLLDALKAHIAIEARQKLAHELDRRAPSALGFEWELALLFALSHVGQVEYEAQSGSNSRRPDITFSGYNLHGRRGRDNSFRSGGRDGFGQRT